LSNTRITIQMVRQLRQKPAEVSEEAAEMLLAQDMEITKLKFVLTKIADGSDPLTVVRSMAQQALVKR
jgi:hypothetical protein